MEGRLKVLLDTHVIVWALGEPEKLSARVRAEVFEAGCDVLFSPVSSYELSLKHTLGRLPNVAPLLADYERYLREAGWTELPLSSADALAAGSLSPAHRDPFDRLLTAQAQRADAALVSRDAALDLFGVRRLW